MCLCVLLLANQCPTGYSLFVSMQIPIRYPLWKLLGRKPIFGVCLGHQILALALGGWTFKMKFGHRSADQPVLEKETGQVFITSQNHGYCVDPSILNPEQVKTAHMNLNDQTFKGMEAEGLGAFLIRHRPEAPPGPNDPMRKLFQKFMDNMHKRKGKASCHPYSSAA